MPSDTRGGTEMAPQSPTRRENQPQSSSSPSNRRLSKTTSTKKLRRKVSSVVEVDESSSSAKQRLVEYFVVVSSHPRWEDRRRVAERERRKKQQQQQQQENLSKKNRSQPKKKTSFLTRRNSRSSDIEDSREENAPSLEKKDASQRQDDDEQQPSPETTNTTEGNIHLMSQQEHPEHTFQPKITARYPQDDHADHVFNPMIVQFCHPHSEVIVPSTTYVLPKIHHFCLTNDKGRKVYGTCLTVYEEFHPSRDAPLHRNTVTSTSVGGDAFLEEIEVTPQQDDDEAVLLYTPKVLCILSTWPYLTAFREYLTQLYRLATTTNMMDTPIERFIINLCREIPAPPPGAFEIQVSILTSTIRFWAPPAKLPVAYVALPYQVLFDCLDISNILKVWYALTLERKVLLLSCQYSILTVCCEILTSLLFPMQWSHLYIPLLPNFLSPMLDAPVPYLVGVVRDNWLQAQHHVSDETIVVDLDRNSVMYGRGTEAMPPVPLKKYNKLKAALEQVAGDLYWKARGIEREHWQLVNHLMSAKQFQQVQQKSETRWNEKLHGFDEAIHLAYTPDSPNNLLNNGTGSGILERQQSQWDRVQECFLRFFVTVLKGYRKFLNMPEKHTADDDDVAAIGKDDHDNARRWNNKQRSFDRAGFVASQKTEYQSFLQELCFTQQFDDFITKRLYSPGEPDVIFFVQNIDAKLNRSRLKIRKVDTPFLQSAQAHKVLNTVHAVAPSRESLPPLPQKQKESAPDDSIHKDTTRTPYVYKTWPETLDPTLFGKPRPIPRMITAEFDRQSALVARLRANREDIDGDEVDGDYNASPEVATFTVFFIAYSAVIGQDWQDFEHNRLKMERTGSLASLSDFEDDDTEFDEARAIASAQLDLAFEVLNMLTMRGLSPDPEAVNSLMEACGRCGDTKRAKELLEIINRDGLVADSEMYSRFMSAFAHEDGTGHASTESFANRASYARRRGSDAYSVYLKKQLAASKPRSWESSMPAMSSDDDMFSECSDTTSDFSLGSSSECHEDNGFLTELYNLCVGKQKASPKKKKPKKKSKKQKAKKRGISARGKDDLLVTEKVKKQVTLGDTLLGFLYPELSMGTNDTCPQCSRVLTEDDVVSGWLSCKFSDFTTGCPVCGVRFVPRFVVKCSAPTFEGSQGTSTPLYCEFLSPWILIKELQHVVQDKAGMEEMLNPEWRSGTDINSAFFWNMVFLFMRYGLPVSFLLQGSFQNRLINPDPDS